VEGASSVINVIPGLFVGCLSVLVAVAGFIYAVLGVAYAVMLGLMIIAVWESFAEARDTVDQEATELAEIAWLAHRLPEPEGTHIQEVARSYAEVVVEE
jgi:hypothetical protein